MAVACSLKPSTVKIDSLHTVSPTASLQMPPQSFRLTPDSTNKFSWFVMTRSIQDILSPLMFVGSTINWYKLFVQVAHRKQFPQDSQFPPPVIVQIDCWSYYSHIGPFSFCIWSKLQIIHENLELLIIFNRTLINR